MRGFYFITEESLSRAGNLSDVKTALSARVKFVQYRQKHNSARQFYQEALLLRRLCRKAAFIVNDRVDIALAVDADGVHLGQSDLPYAAARRLLGKKKIIGITVHSLREAKVAERWGADYLGVAPIFATATKEDAVRPLGVELLSRIKKEIRLPLVAAGGINLKNAPLVISAGADCISAVSAVVASADVKREIQKFQALFSCR
jgi:thiamine-phosphate pyrophosphorylase